MMSITKEFFLYMGVAGLAVAFLVWLANFYGEKERASMTKEQHVIEYRQDFRKDVIRRLEAIERKLDGIHTRPD